MPGEKEARHRKRVSGFIVESTMDQVAGIGDVHVPIREEDCKGRHQLFFPLDFKIES